MNFNSKKSWIDLYRKDSEQSWEFFLKYYNQLIMSVIHKMVNDYDESMEIYSFTIEKLKSHNFKKLTSYFSKERSYDFNTWVAVVARNCCFDWFRKEKGRKRLLKCINNLPELDQTIFKHIYWQGYSYEETYNLLNNNHDYNISFEEMISKIKIIEESLQEKTNWKVCRDWNTILPPLPIESVETRKINTIENNPSPEEQFIKETPNNILQKIIKSLTPQEQLIIQLHYYKDMSLDKIARILKMKNLWRVRRKLQKILRILEKKLQEKGISPADLDL